MRCGKIIGTIGTNKKIFEEVGDEKFYKTDITIEGELYPAVMSEHVTCEGKAEIECFIASQTIDEKLFTYIFVLTAKKVSEDTEDNGRLSAGGVIYRNTGLRVDGKVGDSLLLISLKYKSTVGRMRKNILHCVVKGRAARELVAAKQFEVLELEGLLKKNEDRLVLEVDSILYKGGSIREPKAV